MAKIVSVERRSPAARLIKVGDELVSINGNEIKDILDYMYYSTASDPVLTVIREGAELSVTVEKEEYDDLGLEFDSFLMDSQKSCSNKCIFCFIDQNPKGMRDTIYVKDDDLRLSFMHGNYITLTNLKDCDIDRIIKLKISPINVSVHTLNGELRKKMLGNRFADRIGELMKRLADAHIEMKCQIVLCKGINDGKELLYTLNGLKELYPAVSSISVVPVGLTDHREGLYPLEAFDKESSTEVIDIVTEFGDKCLSELGTRLVFPADEFFIKAGLPCPDAEFYEEFEQLENGVGLLSLFDSEVTEALSKLKTKRQRHSVSVATGVAACKNIVKSVDEIAKKVHNLRCNVFAIENNFFGKSVTVSGLVTATDIIEQLKGKELGEYLLIPSSMLRFEGDMFLDSLTPKDVEKALGVKLRIVGGSGSDFVSAVMK